MTYVEAVLKRYQTVEREELCTWHCPSEYGYANKLVCMHGDSKAECISCWNREMPEEWMEQPAIKDSGERTKFSTGAVRDMHEGKGRMDLLPWYGILEVAKHCEEGAKKYGEHNVDKGIPLHSLLDSASRHIAKVLCGMEDEDHLRAAAWNILWALNQRTTHPELDDLYREVNNGSQDH